MKTILENILNEINTPVGVMGSLITIYDHFKNRGSNYTKEIYSTIRQKSKMAYKLYCEHVKNRFADIGIPTEESILDYWESCLKRNVLPSVDDLVSPHIASKQEAEIMLPYLLQTWMEVPDFVEWLNEIFILKNLDELAEKVINLQENFKGISLLKEEIEAQKISPFVNLISANRITDFRYSCQDSDVKYYFTAANNYITMFRVISAQQDIPHKEANEKVMELIEKGVPTIIAGNGGVGKTSLMMRAAIQWASEGRWHGFLYLVKILLPDKKQRNF